MGRLTPPQACCTLDESLTKRDIMTVVENEHGQHNIYAKEPDMYISESDAERYALETYAERAEKLNAMYAMLGVIAGLVSYAITGNLFFGLY